MVVGRGGGSLLLGASVSVTLQGVPKQRVQLRVELGLLLQHVEEQLVLCGASDLRLLEPALHHLHLGLTLGGLQALWIGGGRDLVETKTSSRPPRHDRD